MKNIFTKTVILLSTFTLAAYMIPELYVILFSDISINELLLKNTPVHITLWVHRYSLISVFAAAAVIFMLIFKIRNANYYSAILLTLFLVTSLSLLGQPPVEEAERIVERIEYNDEAYGLFAEKIFHILLYIYEIFLLYVLLRSKRIIKYFNNEYKAS